MSDLTRRLLQLIIEEKSVNEIANTLNMSNKQVYNHLALIKNKGLEFERKYYSNGEIVYVPKKSLAINCAKDVGLITEANEDLLKFVVISDLHIGSIHERIDLLEKVYDYCIKENIHLIINCGDLIDGMCTQHKKKIDNVYEQADYTLKNYPFDKNILNFIIFGNHDYDALRNYGLNLETLFDSYRHDLVALGYFQNALNIKNDFIVLRHPWEKLKKIEYPYSEWNSKYNKNVFLVLNGHSHKMRAKISSSALSVSIPSLSNIPCPNEGFFPSFVVMELKFRNGLIEYGSFHQMIINDKIERISEFDCYLGLGKDLMHTDPINLEEDYTKKKIKTKGF